MANEKDMTYNDLHIKSVLVMLPYDADKVASYPLDFKINGKTPSTSEIDSNPHIQKKFPIGTVVSFLDADKRTVYYKLIADSDAQVKPEDYSRSHDAAAFVELDATGKEIKNANGKSNVIVTFPGRNDPGLSSDDMDVYEDSKGSSYQEKFFSNFVTSLEPQLTSRGLTFADTKAIGHGTGDKHAAEYAARFNANAMIVSGWNKKDALTFAVTRNLLHENLGKPLSDKQFQEAFAEKMMQTVGNITEVNPESVLAVIPKHVTIGSTVYSVSGTGALGWTAKGYMFKTPADVVQGTGISNVTDLVNNAYKSEFKGLTTVEADFEQSVQNNLAVSGKSKEEQAAIMNDLVSKLSASGIQVGIMEDAAQKYLSFKPIPDQKAKSSKAPW